MIPIAKVHIKIRQVTLCFCLDGFEKGMKQSIGLYRPKRSENITATSHEEMFP